MLEGPARSQIVKVPSFDGQVRVRWFKQDNRADCGPCSALHTLQYLGCLLLTRCGADSEINKVRSWIDEAVDGARASPRDAPIQIGHVAGYICASGAKVESILNVERLKILLDDIEKGRRLFMFGSAARHCMVAAGSGRHDQVIILDSLQTGPVFMRLEVLLKRIFEDLRLGEPVYAICRLKDSWVSHDFLGRK